MLAMQALRAEFWSPALMEKVCKSSVIPVEIGEPGVNWPARLTGVSHLESQ